MINDYSLGTIVLVIEKRGHITVFVKPVTYKKGVGGWIALFCS